ncbi:MAG: efflux RND transporter periplasmic adaptor subunit [Acidobacteriaceae bacterium]|nr:efflux RND transporter periplasmic adaptor subunit [Acidobacteriaceae bacterium]
MQSKHLGVLAVVVLGTAAAVVAVRHAHHPEEEENTQENNTPVVSVLAAETGAITQDLTVAGVFQPFQEIDVHSKVSGYIRKIYVDIGDRVQQGQSLAVLEVPELDAQVEAADAGVVHSQQDIERLKSDIGRAEAGYTASHANYTRLRQASDQQPGLVAAQELDDALARDRAAAAQVEAARAAVAAAQGQLLASRADRLRVKSMVEYATITAPFSGVVTMRYADTGSLVPAGTTENNAQAVVRLAQSDLLRLRMPVPEQDVPLIQQGAQVMVHVQATGQQFSGTVVRFTRSVSTATRTMLCEVDVPNPKLTLTPGMFADVSFHLHQSQDSILVPSAAVIQGDKPAVFVVDTNGLVQRQPVVLGISAANEQAIASGIHPGELVVVGDTASLQPGTKVITQKAAKDLVSYQAASSKGGK